MKRCVFLLCLFCAFQAHAERRPSFYAAMTAALATEAPVVAVAQPAQPAQAVQPTSTVNVPELFPRPVQRLSGPAVVVETAPLRDRPSAQAPAERSLRPGETGTVSARIVNRDGTWSFFEVGGVGGLGGWVLESQLRAQ